jgi:membrane protease YdiL (CAAX protease family)
MDETPGHQEEDAREDPPGDEAHGEKIRYARPVPRAWVYVLCPECAKKLKPTARFCSRCGKRISAALSSSVLRRSRRGVARFRPITSIRMLKEWKGIRNVIIFYAVMLGLNLLLGRLIDSPTAFYFTADTMFVILVLSALALIGKDYLHLFTKPGFPLWAYGLVAAGCVATYLLMSLFVGILTSALGLEGTKMTDVFKEKGYGFFIVVISVAVIPGIFEEIAFRGIIQSTLMKNMKPWAAIIASAAVFGIIHLQFLNFGIFFLGIYLGWLRWRSGSIYPGILAHFGHNFTVVFVEWYM